MPDLMMSLQTAEDLARAYAQLERRKRELDEMFKESTGRTPAAVKDELRQFMELEGLDEWIDGETGLGVHIDKESKGPDQWDTRSMPDDMVLGLKAEGHITVISSTFDAARKANDSALLHDAERYRTRTTKAGAFRVITGS